MIILGTSVEKLPEDMEVIYLSAKPSDPNSEEQQGEGGGWKGNEEILEMDMHYV